jgi:hypothetical protein
MNALDDLVIPDTAASSAALEVASAYLSPALLSGSAHSMAEPDSDDPPRRRSGLASAGSLRRQGASTRTPRSGWDAAARRISCQHGRVAA